MSVPAETGAARSRLHAALDGCAKVGGPDGHVHLPGCPTAVGSAVPPAGPRCRRCGDGSRQLADLLAADVGPWQLVSVGATVVLLEWAGYALFTLQPVASGQPAAFDAGPRWVACIPKAAAALVAASLTGPSPEWDVVDLPDDAPRTVAEVAQTLLADAAVGDVAAAVALAGELVALRR